MAPPGNQAANGEHKRHAYSTEGLILLDKNSCGLSLVVFEQATKPFTILNRAVIPALWPGLWKEQDIALALMIALLVVMLHILVEHMPQGVFAEQNHP